MDRFLRSWELFKSSLAVMILHKSLLVFPIVTAAITIFICFLFVMPVAFQPTGHSYTSGEHWKAVGNSVFNIQAKNAGHEGSSTASDTARNLGRSGNWGGGKLAIKPIWIGYFAIMYFVSMFMATFLNVAFYRAIMNALTGQPVSIMEGLGYAMTRWKIILVWTLFAGVIGYIIKTLEQRFGFLGQMFMKLIGAVWSIACVFVIPVIVMEKDTVNPFAVLKKSAQTIIATWGESLIGYAGVSLGGSVVAVLSLIWLGATLTTAIVLHSIFLGAAAVVCWITVLCVLNYLASVASQIFRCALYLYATQGTMPHPYTSEMAALAWKTKKK